MPDQFLDDLNAAWRLSPIDGLWERVTPLPFANRHCGRIDAAFRQSADLSPNDIEALIHADNLREANP